MSNIDEQRLIQLAAKGDCEAFEQLLRRYESAIWRLCYRMTANEEDAADLTQEALVRVWQKLPDFRFRSSFSTWLYRLTTNLCLDFLRSKKRRPTVPLEREDDGEPSLPEPRDPAPTPEEAILASEEQERLQKALAALEPEQRRLLALRVDRELNYAQMAEILSVPEGTVKSRLARAREALRKKLSAVGNFRP